MEKSIIVIDDFDDEIRIDRFLSESEKAHSIIGDLSRSFVQKLIKEGNIKVNNKNIKSSYVIGTEDCIEVTVPDLKVLDIAPENIPLDIVYEDDDIIIVNKPKGMVVHPANGHMSGTLVNALMYHCKDNLSGINGVLRPGIVHRIDMNTTGLLVVCKNDYAHLAISEQLKVHSITRVYHAIVNNRFKEESGTVDQPIGRSLSDRKKMAVVPNGREAVTHYKVIQPLKGNYSYIECRLETGRTHQIRVHMSYIRHALYGDNVYGSVAGEKYKIEGQALHAKVLGFVHPRTGKYVEFDSELPEYFDKLLLNL